MLDLGLVFSLTDFLRNHKEIVARLSVAHKPVVPTVNGKFTLVIQDSEGRATLIEVKFFWAGQDSELCVIDNGRGMTLIKRDLSKYC